VPLSAALDGLVPLSIEKRPDDGDVARRTDDAAAERTSPFDSIFMIASARHEGGASRAQHGGHALTMREAFAQRIRRYGMSCPYHGKYCRQ
jgi:hypothetical protein